MTPGQPLLGEKYVAQKEEKKIKRNILKNSEHFVPQQCLRAAHALRSDQHPLEDNLQISHVE
jgi:hypothetical protein